MVKSLLGFSVRDIIGWQVVGCFGTSPQLTREHVTPYPGLVAPIRSATLTLSTQILSRAPLMIRLSAAMVALDPWRTTWVLANLVPVPTPRWR